ncbi:MAG: vitamin K epoxide reductase [Chloroflexi bacterium]|jgi:uncharacterized membrane protein|nr:vitamin K epoxide reductase [Chloroflexota bacterium]
MSGGRAVRLLAAVCLAAALAGAGAARADAPVVRAVLFFLPSCGHCEKVMTVDLPPLVATHGDALQIAIVDISVEQGAALYEAAVTRYDLAERRGVPALVVGDAALVGSVEIPERFPALVDELLAAGGTDWPDIPGLAEAMAAAATAAPASPSTPAAATTAPSPAALRPAATGSAEPAGAAAAATVASGAVEPGPLDRLARDPAGNGLALVVLVAMLVVLAAAVGKVWRSAAALLAEPPPALIVPLALVGLGVAAYLAFVETASVEAVCGPVGDCNTVQQSEHATVLGLVPIGVLGVAGYAAILSAWTLGTRGAAGIARAARIALLAMLFAGTGFSIYLTFLEPFVIGATCSWCLTSAVLMTASLAVAVRVVPARRSTAASATAP